MYLVDKKLSTLTLALMIIAIIISPIGMVIMAQYGASSVFYYALVILLFFIPSAFIFAELGSTWPEEGGLYRWTSMAFGKVLGSTAVWVRWLSMVITFPIIITFISSMTTYVFAPQLTHSTLFTFMMCIAMTALSTCFAYFGVRGSTLVSLLAAMGASIIPSLILIIAALVWLCTGHASLQNLDFHHMIPHFNQFGIFALLGATVLMFSGMEVTAYCLKYTEHPRKQFPKALIIGMVVIIFLALFGTLAVAVLVPSNQLDVVAGMMQAFLVFFNYYHLHALIYLITGLMIFGWVCVIATIMTTLGFGLKVLGKDGLLPRSFDHTNHFQAPTRVVFLQGAISMLLSSLYIVIPGINSTYWTIESISSIISGFLYVLLFAVAVRLRYLYPKQTRPICIPGGNVGMWVLAILAAVMCFFAAVMTFAPPAQFSIERTVEFELVLITGVMISFLGPLLLSLFYYQRGSHSRR